MGLFDSITSGLGSLFGSSDSGGSGSLLSSLTGLFDKGDTDGNGAGLLSGLFSGSNLGLLGASALGQWGASSALDEQRRTRDEDRAFSRETLAQQLAMEKEKMRLEQMMQAAALASAAGKANLEAAIAKEQLKQDAFKSAINSLLTGGGLTSNTLQSAGTMMSGPLLKG